MTHVKKRNGRLELLDVDKINRVVSRVCDGLEDVSASEIVLDAKLQFYDKIPTTEIDQALILTTRSKIEKEPNYSYVGARLLLNNLYKEVFGEGVDADIFDLLYRKSFISNIKKLVKENRLDKRMLDFDLKALSDKLVLERDSLFKYLGIQVLYDRYLLTSNKRRMETPQAFWMRVAMGLAINEENKTEKALEFYDLLSQFHGCSATPTLFNSGTTHPQLSSCFLNTFDDSIDGIFEGLWQEARKSKYAGGLGFDVTPFRSTGSYIKGTNGSSSGLIPWLKLYNDTLVAVNQGGKRAGAGCAYLEPWHMDVEDFIDLRRPTGEERRRCHDMNIALWIPDLFMEKIENDEDWYLFCPSETSDLHDLYGEAFNKRYEKYIKKAKDGELENFRVVKAKDLWKKILKSVFETSHPWITFKDASNERYSNKHKGVVHSSNLCVAPETLVLTDVGHQIISELENELVNVWNGSEYSTVKILKTGTNQQLYKVTLSDGKTLTCTNYHKWYVIDDYGTKPREVKTQELVEGQKLIKLTTPLIEGKDEFNYAYTHGLFCAEGTYTTAGPRIPLYDEKKKLISYIDVKSSSYKEDNSGRINVSLPNDIATKFYVPHTTSIENKLNWLAGLFDGDGCICKNGENESLQLASIEHNFLIEVQLLLQTLGVQSKIVDGQEEGYRELPDGKGGYKKYFCKELKRILISSNGLYQLSLLGINFNRLKYTQRKPQRCADHFVTVISIEKDRVDDTYCFNEPKKHMGVFNGILTGNCTEILLHTVPSEYEDGKKTKVGETAVCNLSSINLSRHVKNKKIDWNKLAHTTQTLIRMLDNVIDINFYPTEETANSNRKHRPIGLGEMGFHDVCHMLDIIYDSAEGVMLADNIQEFISYHALLASSQLARERGAYSTYKGSDWDKGILPIDTAKNIMPDNGHLKSLGLNWDIVRESIKTNGMRNSNTMAIAPTATISYIQGCEQSIEPNFSTLFVYENKSGNFYITNEYFVADMKKLGLWSYSFAEEVKMVDGDVMQLNIPDKYKAKYKTAFDRDMFKLIDAAAARQKWIDMGQSFNIYNSKQSLKYLNDIAFDAWRKGLKTTYYWRNKAASKIEKSTSVTAKAINGNGTNGHREEVKACSIEAMRRGEVCESCQ